MAGGEEEEDFRTIILNILNRWSALKMMVDHQMGGRQSLDKALYLVDYIHHVFQNNQTVESEDLEDLVVEYMDSEFNTTLEDGSPIEVSRTLVRLFALYTAGGLSAAVTELRTLPPVSEWLEFGAPVRSEHVEDSDSDDDEPMNEEESEWTQVSYTRKR